MRCVESLEPLLAAGERFGTIYADPPWRYDHRAVCGKGAPNVASDQYKTLGLDEIRALPVGDLAAERSHLHLWTTSPLLPAAFSVIEAWGFEYKSSYVWCKDRGMGSYWLICHEILLLGVRGGMTFNRQGERSWDFVRRSRHSEKPELVRKRIEKVSPAPRLELFGRRPVEGWTVFGNEIEPDLFSTAAGLSKAPGPW